MRLIAKKKLDEKFDRWDFETKKHHCFTASGIIVHNCNFRMGLIRTNDNMEFMVGSHNVRLKEFNSKGQKSEFWSVFNQNAKDLLNHLSEDINNVIIFAELYGQVQDMNYGLKGFDYRAFDISINGNYLDHNTKMDLFAKFNIEIPPILYEGPFSWNLIEELTIGNTQVCKLDEAGRFKGREGIVITPKIERLEFEKNLGRVILKSISADYLSRKNATEFH